MTYRPRRLLILALLLSLSGAALAACGERTGIEDLDQLLDQVDPQPEPDPEPEDEPDPEPSGPPPPPDETPPAIVFGGPDEPCLEGEVTFTFAVTDDDSEVGIVRAELSGSELTLAEEPGGIFKATRDTAPLFQGLHTLIVTAIDTSNNLSESERVFGKADPGDYFVAADFTCGEPPPDSMDLTPPEVDLVRPSSGDVVGATVEVQATAYDDVGPVTLSAAGAGASTPMVGASGLYTGTLDLAAADDGTLQVTVTAVDGANREATATVTVDVDRTGPSLEILEPAEGATVVALTDVVVRASDERQLDRVLLLENGNVLAVAVNPNPGTTDEFALFYSLPCEGLPRATTFVLQARDRAGNLTSASRNVTVTAAGCQ